MKVELHQTAAAATWPWSLEPSMYKLLFTERVTNVWNSHPSYIVHAPSIEAYERRIDRYWRNQDIVYNYEVTLSLNHSDRDRNDISPDSSDNDLDIQV